VTGTPGPWASGYVFPDLTSGAPAAPPPQPVQATPQPPPQDPTQEPAPTPQTPLGTVTQAGMSPSEIQQRFNEYLKLTQAANATAKRDYLPEDTKPGILANVLTFGMAGAMDADYRRSYNAAIDAHNSKLNATAAHQALEMTNQDMRSAHGDLGQQINLLRLKMQMDQNEFNNLIKGLGLKLNLGRYGLQQQQFERGGLHPPPKTPEERAALYDQGYVWQESPDYPGLGTYVRPGGAGGGGTAGGGGGGAPGGTVRPVDPNSPLGKELPGLAKKPTGQPGQPTAPGGPTPPLTTAQLNEQKAAQAAKAEADKVRTLSLNEVQTSGDSIVKWLQDPQFNRAINNVLPSKETTAATGGLARYGNPWVMSAKGWLGDKQTMDDVQYLKSASGNIIKAIRSLSSGSKGLRINIPEIELLGQQWKRLASGQMNREEAAAFKRTFVKVYNQVVTGLGGKAATEESETSKTNTPTSTLPPSSTTPSTTTPPSTAGSPGGLPGTGTTRGGVQWRVVTP
jgi:hypothetical protein